MTASAWVSSRHLVTSSYVTILPFEITGTETCCLIFRMMLQSAGVAVAPLLSLVLQPQPWIEKGNG